MVNSQEVTPNTSAVVERPGVDQVLGFDQVLEQLRQVVGKLEQGSLSLEQSLQAFEEGVRLARQGSEILDQAEHRVEVLSKGEDGAVRGQALAGTPAG